MAKRALILADHDERAELIQSHVRKLGANSQIVSCIDAAVRFIDDGTFHAMIGDLDLADEKSVDFVKNVRARGENIPVVLFCPMNPNPLPKVLRDDYCFVIDKFDFKQMREVLTLIFEDGEGH